MLASCNDSTGPRPSVTVAVETVVGPGYVADSTGHQLIQCTVTLQARNTGQRDAGWMDATFAFYPPNGSRTPFGVDTIPAATVRSSWGGDSIEATHDQVAQWVFTSAIPFTLTMRFAYGMDGAAVASSTVSMACEPSNPSGPPPTVTLQDHVDTAPEPGDTLHVSFSAASPVGLWQTIIHVTGPCNVTQLIPEQAQHTATHDVAVPLSATCSLGVPISVTASVLDARLQQSSGSLTLPVLVDHRPPRLTVTVSTPRTDLGALAGFTGYLLTGETLTVSVAAIDNRALHGVYWEAQPAGVHDSILGGDSALSRTFGIPIQGGWSGGIRLRLYAKDALGNVSDTLSSSPEAIQVGPSVGPPPTVTIVPGGAADVAFDAKRGVLYLLQGDRIAVFSPASHSVIGTIALPDVAPDFDLSPSGDSIIAVLTNSRALGIVDLTQASPAFTTVPLAPLDSAYHPLKIRVASTGRALIVAERYDSSITRLYGYDPATGTLRERLDAAGLGYNAGGPLEHSTNRQVIIVNGVWASFMRYDANSDAFQPGQTAHIQDSYPSVDSTGAHVAVAGDLYDASLLYVRTVGVALGGQRTAVISPDGQTHYMVLGPNGVGRSRVSDGSMIDYIPIPMSIDHLRISPDGSTLWAAGSVPDGPGIVVIDLSQLH